MIGKQILKGETEQFSANNTLNNPKNGAETNWDGNNQIKFRYDT